MTHSSALAWKSLAFADVSRASLEKGLGEAGVDWRSALHVTATGSLAKTMRDEGWPAVSVKDLTDMVIWSGMPGRLLLPVALPPLLDSLPAFEMERNTWRRRLRGRSIALDEDAIKELRRFLDSQTGPARAPARILRQAAAELLLSIRSLASAGIHPSQLSGAAGRTLIETAVDAWSHLEGAVPHLFRAREDLWSPSAETTARTESVLTHLSGNAGPWSLVYHGFYFFTAPQWAWFTLLKNQLPASQYFVIHDDGTPRVFEIWHRFFDGRWGMPASPPPAGPEPSPIGDRLREALEGRRVDVGRGGGAPTVTLTSYRDISEFAADARLQEERAVEKKISFDIFAADSKNIDRIARRFGVGRVARTDLANTPLGQFLLALHSCVKVDADGEVRFGLTGALLLDMAASGCLDQGDDNLRPSLHISAIRRALPFFDGLVNLDDWVARAESLEHTVVSVVAAFGRRKSVTSDIERMKVAATNPLRLAPWCDLSDEEALAVRRAIQRVRQLLGKLESPLITTVNAYLIALRREISTALRLLPKASQEAILAGRRQQSLTGNQSLDIEGIVNVVGMHLGTGVRLAFDEDPEDEDAVVKDLRNLDALAFSPSNGIVHVTNLVDTAFPSRASTIGWPFDRRLLEESNIRPQSHEISRVREESSGLADLYLFWLALHGVRDAGILHLTSIAELGTEQRNPSPLLMLIAELDAGRGSESVVQRAGGFVIRQGAGHTGRGLSNVPPPVPWSGIRDNDLIRAATDQLDPVATASAFACPRRFPLQWALGSTHSFPAFFQHKMLFGNVHGALAQQRARYGLSERDALKMVRDIWRHLTPGERLSSLRKRRVLPAVSLVPPWRNPGDPESRVYSAKPQWIFTLGGKQFLDRSRRRPDMSPLGQAYRGAAQGSRPSAERVAPPRDGEAALPYGDPELNLCTMCPVRPTCASAVLVRED